MKTYFNYILLLHSLLLFNGRRRNIIKSKICLTIISIFLCPEPILSQDIVKKESLTYNRNQIGILFNPFINEGFFRPRGLGVINIVSSVRYGYRITKNITTGIEISCDFPIRTNSGQDFRYFNYFGYKTGMYSRYLFPAHSRFQIYAEASPYFYHYWRETISTSSMTPYRKDKFGYYVAPGLTFYTKSKKVSFDLYYKFSNIMFLNGKRSVLSYKVNFIF